MSLCLSKTLLYQFKASAGLSPVIALSPIPVAVVAGQWSCRGASSGRRIAKGETDWHCETRPIGSVRELGVVSLRQ